MSETASVKTEITKVLLAAFAAVVALVLLWKLLPLKEGILWLVDTVPALGFWGLIVFGVLYVAASLVGFPRTPLNIGAGILFPFPLALAVVMISSSLVFFVTFEISRKLGEDWVRRKLSRFDYAERLLGAIKDESFKFVLLMRLSPFIPAALKDYGLGATAMPLRSYMVASILGSLPVTLMHVYLGYMGGLIMIDGGSHLMEFKTGILALGGAVSLVFLGFVIWLSDRALKTKSGYRGAK